MPEAPIYQRIQRLLTAPDPREFDGVRSRRNCCKGEITGTSFIDSTALKVCHKNRANSHKVFAGLAEWGKSSMGFYFGFKLHLIINDYGENFNFQVTPANVDDRKVVPELTLMNCGQTFWRQGIYFRKII